MDLFADKIAVVPTGYQNYRYAESLAEFGTPGYLPRSEGLFLMREIPGTPYMDGMGLYPLFFCSRWPALADDLAELSNSLVSFSMVTDPFGEFDLQELKANFPDVCYPYKEHYVVDLSLPMESYVSKHHKRFVRKALRKKIEVECCTNPNELMDEWVELYDCLKHKHQIHGIAAFSRSAFEKQFQVPGLIALRAKRENRTVGIETCYTQGDVCYGHLAAFNAEAYTTRASYAMKWEIIRHCQEMGYRWFCMGGGAGVQEDKSDGLHFFKSQWATGTRTVYFCGRILNRRLYAKLTKAREIGKTDFFPAYRAV